MERIPPDYECTSWLDGIPKWMGGTGQEWNHCCIAHDLGGSDVELLNCVNEIWFGMGTVMVVGLLLFRPAWRVIQRKKLKEGKTNVRQQSDN